MTSVRKRLVCVGTYATSMWYLSYFQEIVWMEMHEHVPGVGV